MNPRAPLPPHDRDLRLSPRFVRLGAAACLAAAVVVAGLGVIAAQERPASDTVPLTEPGAGTDPLVTEQDGAGLQLETYPFGEDEPASGTPRGLPPK